MLMTFPARHLPERLALHLGWLAPLWFAAVLAAWAFGLPASAVAPVGQLGAIGASGAAAFNALGLMAPGLALVLFSIALERVLVRDVAGRAARLGTGMLMICALAFAAQGVFPLDLDELDGPVSQRHASALALALLGQIAAQITLALALRRLPRWRLAATLSLLAGAALAGGLIWPPQDLFPFLAGRAGLAQRLLLALWFGWFALIAILALRRTGR